MNPSPTPTGDVPPARAVRAQAGLPPHVYTPWLRRVGAAVIDGIPVAVVFVVCVALLVATRTCIDYRIPELGTPDDPFVQQTCGATAVGQWAAGLFPVLAAAFVLWNHGYAQGRTGQSIGKRVMKFAVVGEETGQPIGFGKSVVRQLAHVVDAAICYVGYLFPLWDPKRQTIADKLLKTVCLPV